MISGLLEPDDSPYICSSTINCILDEDEQWFCSGEIEYLMIKVISDDETRPSCVLNDGMRCYGYAEKFSVSKKNAEKCCNKCRKDILCVAWSFEESDKMCYGYYDRLECLDDQNFKGGTFV